jgi:hypothetical protein
MTFNEKNFIILQKNVVGDLGKLKETASWWIEMVATQKGALTLSRYQETSHLIESRGTYIEFKLWTKMNISAYK